MTSRLLLSRSIKRFNPPQVCRLLSSQNVVADPAAQQEKPFREKIRQTWHGPTFKYWFIGGTGFLSWLTYYSYKAYKNKCINVELLPALPLHVTVERKNEIIELLEKQKAQESLFQRNIVKRLFIQGPSASGKTVLVNQFVKYLRQSHASSLGLPNSVVNLFLNADSEVSFLISLKAAAAKLDIKPTDLDEVLTNGKTFNESNFTEQCNALLENIQEKLLKHPGWILVFDQLQSTSPKNVLDMIKKIGLKNDGDEAWSSGTIIMVANGITKKHLAVGERQTYTMKRGMSQEDGVDFLKKLVNVDGELDSLNILAEKVFSSPIGILCAGIMLKQKLSLKEARSIDDIVKETCKEIESNVKQVLQNNQHMSTFTSTISGLKLVTMETVIAMVLQEVMMSDPYLKHGLDLLASLAPGVSVPQPVVTRHLASSFYKLPSLAKAPNILDFMNKQKRDAEEVKQHSDEYDPKGKAWSNKNLAHYMRKVEDFFETSFKTMKDIYFLVYGEVPELPVGDDGMGMFTSCELVQTSVVEPGSVKCISLHPMVYNAARQHFLSSTTFEQEEKHVESTKQFYLNKSWYRQMNTFNEQATLQQFRNAAGLPTVNKNLSDTDSLSLLFRYNLGIDVSCIFKKDDHNKTESFWQPKNVEQVGYLQDHLSRTIHSLCEQLLLSKGDLTGHTSKKLLMVHLEYIIKNQPFEIIGQKNQVEGLFSLAKAYRTVYKDAAACKQLLDQVLEMQKSVSDTSPLDYARTLAETAQYYINEEDHENAKKLLIEASDIYEAQRRKLGEYKQPIEYGKVLGTLGAVYGSLNMKIESKETIERALMMQQSVPPDTSDEEKSKRFGADFASTLIDLGHAYVSLGLPLYGKKILDLALAAQKNLNGEDHPEVVRALTVLAIAHLMQGHNAESKKLRKEAGKIQANINKIPLY